MRTPDVTRRSFLEGAAAFAGFAALGGLPVFPAAPSWRPRGKPNLVFGILSDTHLQSGWDGVKPHGRFPLTYVRNAMKLFRERNIDAFMHLGDAAHRGKNVELQYHRDIFDKCFPHGKARDGHTVEKLLVVGNHELYGNVAGGPGAWAPNIWKDPGERAKHVLCGDLPNHWNRIWGEKYEKVWHKEVKGYHFFGRHWSAGEMEFAKFVNSKADELSLKGKKPFFILSHKRNHFRCNHALRAFPNAVAFFGHWHQSNADWKTIYFDSFGGFFPCIQVGACRMDGGNALDGNERITKGDVVKEELVTKESAWQECKTPSRQAMIVNVYDDFIVFERHEVGLGGKLGPDWVMPLGNCKPHPFSRDELKKAVGEPRFPRGAKLNVESAEARVVDVNGGQVVYIEKKKGKKNAPKIPVVRVTIPLADGNPKSRPYAYDAVVVGDNPEKRLFKSVIWEGCNLGIGHEPDRGLTFLDIPRKELPEGRTVTIAVRPLSSLGTKGKPIAATFNVVTGAVKTVG